MFEKDEKDLYDASASCKVPDVFAAGEIHVAGMAARLDIRRFLSTDIDNRDRFSEVES